MKFHAQKNKSFPRK